jgi:hypothetical protein
MTLHRPGVDRPHRSEGIPGAGLPDDDLLRELASLHHTRHDTLRHGSADALDQHTRRVAELESEYLRRFPGREIDPSRLRQPAQP